MKIFFEEYSYSKEAVVANGLPLYLTSSLKNGKVSIPYVGYYFSPEQNDSYFILPKVFINQTVKASAGNNMVAEEKAFGMFEPESIIDTSDSNNPLVKSRYYHEVFYLSTWIYRAIARYKERNADQDITQNADIQNVVSVNGNESETLIDIILQLIRFNNEHRNLFTYIARIRRKGDSHICWNKTICKVKPFFQDDVPVYMRLMSKNKVINLEEPLIVLFFSVLDYLQQKYNFSITRDVNYTTYPRNIEKLINSGKGSRLLRSIRKEYFKDELVKLWKLLKVFFDKAESVASRHYHEETLLVRNFNMVFEDMIDALISDDTKKRHTKLKDQPDGKIVDHIYRYSSLITENEDIYYIGDSKYYKEGHTPGENSIYKQFTYARNVIQFNMDIFNPENGDLGRRNYYDESTEGYNITPNFFIRGVVHPDNINYVKDELMPTMRDDETPDVEEEQQHANRLFDRDTLIIQKYSINFLYVLSAYVLNSNDTVARERIHKKFRNNLLYWLNNNYQFFKLTSKGTDIETLVRQHFRDLIGKIYSFDDNLILAVNKKYTEANSKLIGSLTDSFQFENFEILPLGTINAIDAAIKISSHNHYMKNSANLMEGQSEPLLLKRVHDDPDVDTMVNRMIDGKTTILSIVSACEAKFNERYPAMSTKNWYHIIRWFVTALVNDQDIMDDELINLKNAG